VAVVRDWQVQELRRSRRIVGSRADGLRPIGFGSDMTGCPEEHRSCCSPPAELDVQVIVNE